MDRMRWTKRLDDDEWVRVRVVLGFDDPTELARARGAGVVAVAVAEGLVVLTEEGDSAVAWHEIVRGGWDSGTGRLRWEFLDGSGGSVVLDRPGKLPEVFRARVNESIAATRTIPVPGGDVLIAGRVPAGRLAADDSQPNIIWTAVARGSADLTDPETSRRVVEATEELKQEWN